LPTRTLGTRDAGIIYIKDKPLTVSPVLPRFESSPTTCEQKNVSPVFQIPINDSREKRHFFTLAILPNAGTAPHPLQSAPRLRGALVFMKYEILTILTRFGTFSHGRDKKIKF
jgi:hypothetical protein